MSSEEVLLDVALAVQASTYFYWLNIRQKIENLPLLSDEEKQEL
jgi:hypothetical protein